jgi:hypothetical protein
LLLFDHHARREDHH